MKLAKFVASLLASTMLFVGLAACGAPANNTQPTNSTDTSSPANASPSESATGTTGNGNATDKKVVIGMSMNALDVFQTEWLSHLQNACDAQGVELIVTNAEGHVDKQLADVEALIERKPDVIMIKAVDSDGVVPAFETCEKAGIPTVASDIWPAEAFTNTLRIGVNQYTHGLMQNYWFVNKLDSDPNFSLKLGYIWGSQGMSVLFDRYQGFLDGLLNAYPGRVELIAEKVCNWSASEAMAVTEDWLQAFPEMNSILVQSDEMALGCINVLKAANTDFDNFYICATDGSPEARDALRDGSMKATIYYDKKTSAEFQFGYAMRIAGGEKLSGETIDYTETANYEMDLDNLQELLTKFGLDK